MPSRRHRSTPQQPVVRPPAPTGSRPVDAAERFAAALKESEAIERERRRKDGAARAEQARVAAVAAAQADELRQARRRLERAIEGVRESKRRGTGTVDADREWKAAKARVIELETGTAPSWAPAAVTPDAAPTDEVSADEVPADEVPADEVPADETPADESGSE